MEEQRKQKPRRSARTNKGSGGKQTLGGGGPANNSTTNDEEWRAFMEAYDKYKNHNEHSNDQCKSLVDAHIKTMSIKKMTLPSLGIQIPANIVSGGVSAKVLTVVEADYRRAQNLGENGASSDVGASSWRVRDHKKMENTEVGPDPDANADDAASDAVSEDTISVGSGYTVRPSENGASSASAASGSVHAGRIKLGCSYVLGGHGLGSTDLCASAASSGLVIGSGGGGGEKRNLASLKPNEEIQAGQLVTPFGRSIAKRPNLLGDSTDSKRPSTNRDGWNGLDPNLLHDILARLNLREKVRCAGKICRAWSELRTRSDLFTDLSDDSGPTATEMHMFLKCLGRYWHPPSCTS